MTTPFTHKFAVLCMASSTLLSCGAEQASVNSIQLSEHQTLRQLRAIDGNPLKLSVAVNSGPEQFFTFDNGGSMSLDITGVLLEEQNQIQLVWFEMLNGFDVEISVQEQQFFPDGNTNIDAPHQHTQFDYDGDGVSNFDERLAGTCVWFTEDDCSLDAPNSGSLSDGNFDLDTIIRFPDQAGTNVLFNSDLSQGLDGWFIHSLTNVTSSNGEICFSTVPDSRFPENASLSSFQGLFLLEAGVRYTLAANIRSDTTASAVLDLHGPEPNFINANSSRVDIGPTYRTVSTSFIAQAEQAVLVSLQFGDGTSKNYCVDNVVLVEGEL